MLLYKLKINTENKLMQKTKDNLSDFIALYPILKKILSQDK